MIKDTLQDIVAHTHSLGFLPTIKITGTESETRLESIADDKSVVMFANTHTPVAEFVGVFGLPNLDTLNIHLKCPEYQDNAKIEVIRSMQDGVEIPTTLHFENSKGDCVNDYRFMKTDVINEKIKSTSFRGPKWVISCEPSISSIQRLKYQSIANSHEKNLSVSTVDDNLVFSFGNAATATGSFVFQNAVSGKLSHKWSWPIQPIIQILGLAGTKNMNISDAGIMQIDVDSGLAVYKYILISMA